MGIDFDTEGRPRKARSHTTLTFDPSTGALPPWMTVGGGHTEDTGVTSAFESAGTMPLLRVTSAAQSGTNVRRAAVFGPPVNMAVAIGLRLRAMVAAGSSASVHTVSMGFMTNPALAATAKVELVQVDSSSTGPADVNVLGAGVTETKKSYLRILAAPARNDIFLHLTPDDGVVELGREGESDWANPFTRDFTAQVLYPFVMLRTKGDAQTARMPLLKFQIDIDWK